MADPVYLDANVLIAIVEMSGHLTSGQAVLLSDIESGRVAAVSSDLALAECLVRPISQDDVAGVAAFLALFDSGAFGIVALDRPVLVEAARQRALNRMKLPDAMHVASALIGGCAGFVTADQGIRLPGAIRRIAWDGLADSGQAG